MLGNRFRQFREASNPPTEGDYALAEALLPGELRALFRSQHPRDIVHGAATARWLMARGEADPDLLTAALVHDIGKGHQRRRDRVAWVAAEALGLSRLGGAEGSRFELRRALARTAHHSESGAALLSRAGASEGVVRLTRLHHCRSRPGPSGGDPVLALLQQADAAS